MRRRSAEEKRFDELWKQHVRAPFPARLRGEEIAGVDMVLVDSLVAGCVTTWRSSGRPLDAKRFEVLQHCRADLRAVTPHLAGDEEEYYARLEAIAALVLSASTGGSGLGG